MKEIFTSISLKIHQHKSLNNNDNTNNQTFVLEVFTLLEQITISLTHFWPFEFDDCLLSQKALISLWRESLIYAESLRIPEKTIKKYVAFVVDSDKFFLLDHFPKDKDEKKNRKLGNLNSKVFSILKVRYRMI